MQPKNKKQTFAAIVALAVAMVVMTKTCGGPDATKNKIQAPSYTLTAIKLSGEYDANEVAADNKYKGRIVLVSGIVNDIGKDILDDAYIVLGGDIQCMFEDNQLRSFNKLSKGQAVTVKGEISGLILGSVLMRGCSLK